MRNAVSIAVVQQTFGSKIDNSLSVLAEFGVRDANANRRFCHVSQFQGSDSLHYIYNAEKSNAYNTLAVIAIGDKL